MQNIHLDGTGSIAPGQYKDISITGMGECTGDIQAGHIKITGKLKSSGSLTADFLEVTGAAEFTAFIHAKKVKVDGLLVVLNGTELISEEILCSGGIHIDGLIQADTLQADGLITSEKVIGKEISIQSNLRRLAKQFARTCSKIGEIEGNTIVLKNIAADSVKGQTITIGSRCQISSLSCSGTLSLDKNSNVKTISGKYSRL